MRIMHFENPREREVGMKRLLKLADYLETVPKEQFDYGTWWERETDENGTFCGTVGCALGHACMMKSLRDERRCGLHLEPCSEGGTPRLGNNSDVWAGAGAFALTLDEASYLFIQGCNGPLAHAPKKVAAKIRKFVIKARKSYAKGVSGTGMSLDESSTIRE